MKEKEAARDKNGRDRSEINVRCMTGKVEEIRI
jgi:hypothetical protein